MNPPRKLGPFEIESQLGIGGMGIVYRAAYAKTGQTVALKVLTPALSADEGVKKRFAREMEILKRLEHKNVVKYYGGGMFNGQHFYAMELLEGGTVEDLMKKKGRFSWEQTIEVGKSVARALEHAHYYGIIHRDLKPANLFLTKEGRLKLGDFGIARDTGRTALTAAGKTVGTYAYMAPEQITGDPPVSKKTDLYAMGCVLFELLTGRPPFQADNAAQMLMQHLEIKPPRASSLCSDCPIWLESLIEKLLQKEPEDRYYDALAVHTALKDVTKKVAEGASIAKQTVAGDVTVADRRRDPELKKALGKKKKRRKKNRQAFYEQAWFLATCLVLLIAAVTWAVWPMSDAQRFAKGKELMAQAAELKPDDDDRILLFQDAREKYFEPLLEKSPDGPYAAEVKGYLQTIEIDTLRRRAEVKIRFGRDPSGAAEQLYMDARRAEKKGDRMRALGRYSRLIKLVEGREKDRPYLELAEQRRAVIYGKGSSGDLQELVQDALKRAEAHMKKGEVAGARELWEAIINEFRENKELTPLVDKAGAKLKAHGEQ